MATREEIEQAHVANEQRADARAKARAAKAMMDVAQQAFDAAYQALILAEAEYASAHAQWRAVMDQTILRGITDSSKRKGLTR